MILVTAFLGATTSMCVAAIIANLAGRMEPSGLVALVPMTLVFGWMTWRIFKEL